MYKIDIKKLEKELKRKFKQLFFELFFTIIINIIIYVLYFKVSKENPTVGFIVVTVSIFSVLFILLSIKDIINIKKCIKDAKYLTKNGTLLKKQKINISNSFIFINQKPCLYYIDENYKIRKLKIRHALDLFSKSELDLLIDYNNPKRYYIDTEIKTAVGYSSIENNKKFKNIYSYPRYVNTYLENKSIISNISTFIVLIAFFIYIGIVKDDTIIRGASLGASVILMVEILRSISKIINNKKKEEDMKKILKKGKLYTNIKFDIDKKEGIKDTVVVKIEHNGKKLKSDRIKYFPEKDKVNLLIDEESDKYIIDYDINRIDKINV